MDIPYCRPAGGLKERVHSLSWCSLLQSALVIMWCSWSMYRVYVASAACYIQCVAVFVPRGTSYQYACCTINATRAPLLALNFDESSRIEMIGRLVLFVPELPK